MKMIQKSAALLFCMTLSVSVLAQRGPQGTVEERAEKLLTTMKTELALSDDQANKLKGVLLTRITKMDSVRAANGEDRAAGREGMQLIMKNYSESVKAILTAEQLQKSKQLQEDRRQKMQKGGEKEGRRR